MEFRASWGSRLVYNQLQTVGVLVYGGAKQVLFKAIPGFQPLEYMINQEIATSLQTMHGLQVFNYYVERGNGVTQDWSAPFLTEGADIDNVADQLIKRMKEQATG